MSQMISAQATSFSLAFDDDGFDITAETVKGGSKTLHVLYKDGKAEIQFSEFNVVDTAQAFLVAMLTGQRPD